jgi:hypothetical protein
MEPATTSRAGHRRGPPLAPLVLAAQERSTLQRWARRPSSAQALALRCRSVLACAEGVSNSQVARQVGVARSMVTKWRARFVADRLDGLVDEPRPGAPRTISDEQVERVLVMTLETTPTRPKRRYQRTASTITSGGKRKPAKVERGGIDRGRWVVLMARVSASDHLTANATEPRFGLVGVQLVR